MNIKKYIQSSIETKKLILENEAIIKQIEKAANIIITAYKNNNKVILAGNGGSAADAQHIASELVSKMLIKRSGLNAIALTANSSVITSISNDYGYGMVFSKQIQAFGEEGDVFIGISTSGSSDNILFAFEEAKKKKMITIGLSGEKSFKEEKNCDYIIKVPSDETPIIQEAHIMIGHIICILVEEEMFKR